MVPDQRFCYIQGPHDVHHHSVISICVWARTECIRSRMSAFFQTFCSYGIVGCEECSCTERLSWQHYLLIRRRVRARCGGLVLCGYHIRMLNKIILNKIIYRFSFICNNMTSKTFAVRPFKSTCLCSHLCS